MKYKVGDKVRIVDDEYNSFRNGEIVKIIKINHNADCSYFCENEFNSEWVSEEEIELLEYTWEDFLKAPIGTKVTFEDGTILVKSDVDRFDNEEDVATYRYIESFNRKDGYGKIIKIEEPTYTTVYELTEQVEEMTMEEVCKALGKNIKIVR